MNDQSDQAFEDRGRLLERLDQQTRNILRELRYLRGELIDRPTRSEQTTKRRISIALVLLFVVFGLQTHDRAIGHCSPGARAKAGVDYFANATPQDFSGKKLQALLHKDVPAYCDIAFPVQNHNTATWPSGLNLVGLAILALALLAMYLWCKWPSWRQSQEERTKDAPPPSPDWPPIP